MNLLDRIEDKLGYRFKDITLLNLALTHKSASDINNERIEFFGDSILSMLISEILITNYPELGEGQLSVLRSSIVSRDTLNKLAFDINLDKEIVFNLGDPIEMTSLPGNALEAIIAAVYLDSGIDICRIIVGNLFKTRIEGIDLKKEMKDSKSLIQEHLQKQGMELPIYITKKAELNNFIVVCEIKDLDIQVTGKGLNTKKAQISAADAALKLIKKSHE